MGEHEYNIDIPLTRQEFAAVAAEITGLKVSSVNATMRVERNRKDGKFAKGFRYRVDSKRASVVVTALRKKGK